MPYLARFLIETLMREWLLALALVLFLLLATYDLALPGLHYDEALEAATPALQLRNSQPIQVINANGVRLGDVRLPLMVQNHIGALQLYAALPFIALFGPTTLALRTMTVLIGVFTLVGVYGLILLLHGRLAAGAAALWLAAFPSFVFWSRQGVFVTNLAPCLAVWGCVAGALCLRGWPEKRPRSGSVFVTGLLFGLAVWAKISALWLVVGLLTWACVVVAIRRHSRRAAMPRLRVLAALAAGFALGALPLILYNLTTGFATLTVVGESASATYLGTSNRDLLANLQTRIEQFGQVVLSSGGEHLAFIGFPHPNWLALFSLMLAGAVITVQLIRRHAEGWQRDLFAPFLILACIAQSCFTISSLWHTHFAIAVWLPALVVGVGFGGRGARSQEPGARSQEPGARSQEPGVRSQESRAKSRAAVLGVVLIIIFTASQVQTTLAYLGDLRVTGGLSSHTTAIDDVSAFLAKRPEHVVALDWGMAAQIEYLTGGNKRVEEVFSFSRATPVAFTAVLQNRFGRNELYLTHVPGQEAFPRRQAFLDAVAAAGFHAEAINVSTRRDGLPMIEVWRVVR